MWISFTAGYKLRIPPIAIWRTKHPEDCHSLWICHLSWPSGSLAPKPKKSVQHIHVVTGLHSIFASDLVEFWNRLNDIEDGDVGAGLCKTLSKCQSATARTARDECRTAFEGELYLVVSSRTFVLETCSCTAYGRDDILCPCS